MAHRNHSVGTVIRVPEITAAVTVDEGERMVVPRDVVRSPQGPQIRIGCYDVICILAGVILQVGKKNAGRLTDHHPVLRLRVEEDDVRLQLPKGVEDEGESRMIPPFLLRADNENNTLKANPLPGQNG